MSLRVALLALLTAGPMTGYDAAKHFHGSVGHLWHAPDSQIYPELRKMAADGFLTATEVPWGRKQSTKTEYSITTAGVEALAAWQRSPLTYIPERDPARLSAAYFEWADPEDARRRLTDHIAHFREEQRTAHQQIEQIRDRSSPTLMRRLAAADTTQHERIAAFKTLAYEGRVARAEAEIAWAESGLALLDELNSAEVPLPPA